MFCGVGYQRQIRCTLIRQWVEAIVGFMGGMPALFVPKDEIDPLVQMQRDVLALQCLWYDEQGLRSSLGQAMKRQGDWEGSKGGGKQGLRG